MAATVRSYENTRHVEPTWHLGLAYGLAVTTALRMLSRGVKMIVLAAPVPSAVSDRFNADQMTAMGRRLTSGVLDFNEKRHRRPH